MFIGRSRARRVPSSDLLRRPPSPLGEGRTSSSGARAQEETAHPARPSVDGLVRTPVAVPTGERGAPSFSPGRRKSVFSCGGPPRRRNPSSGVVPPPPSPPRRRRTLFLCAPRAPCATSAGWRRPVFQGRRRFGSHSRAVDLHGKPAPGLGRGTFYSEARDPFEMPAIVRQQRKVVVQGGGSHQ